MSVTFGRAFCLGKTDTLSQSSVAAEARKWLPGENPRQQVIDPFARNSLWGSAGLRNDLDPETSADYHMDALEFARALRAKYGRRWADAVIFDPPFSDYQADKKYKSANLYSKPGYISELKEALSELVKHGGVAVSFGFNSNGMYIKNGWELRHVQLFNHGGCRNDLIMTVEQMTRAR